MTNFKQWITGLTAEDVALFVECVFCPIRKACQESDIVNEHCYDKFLRWANTEVGQKWLN
jgi:hypothetical protein